MSDAAPLIGGVYGKAPAFGDFIHRRLPTSFVKPWDAWLSRSIAASQAQIGERWSEAYLTSPPWRFALDPGVAGPGGWIGVIASSVDAVRRSYPITVAISLPGDATLCALSADLEPVVAALETIALQLIAAAFTPDEAVAKLEDLCRMTLGAAPRPALSRGGGERLQIGATYPSIAVMTAHLASDPEAAPPSGLSAWWHAGWNASPAANLVVRGLPAPPVFASFLDGSWRERGFADHAPWRD